VSDTLQRLALAVLAPESLIRTPPGWDGMPPLGTIPGLSGVPRPSFWDAVVSADSPGLPGDTVNFVVRDDGSILARQDIAEELLDPLADAVTETVGPPFVAVAVRDEGDVWSAAASEAEVVDLEDAPGDVLEVTRVAGVEDGRMDGAEVDLHLAPLNELLDWQGGDCSLIAHRFKGDTFVVELFPL
jgi:hypothetical protein